MVIPRDSIEYISANVPELSVSDLSNALKRTVEDSFGRVRVRGELSKVAFPASGHMYSALKDDGAVIDAVCWRGQLSKLRIKPEEGLEVICTGRLTTYPARSSYQLIIEQMELAGVGAILKMIEDRRVKLAAEGLFNEDRKRPLPFLPSVIGVITSPTGAVIRDILHRLSDRFPVHVVIWPVNVQGERAAADVAAAITGFNALPADGSIPRPDVLIVARGGGSIEDLMPFNEENVVRAAAASTIPLISAVGHETDTTLIDFASDKRAPTPTAAAEFAVPVRDELNAAVAASALHLDQAVRRRLRDARARLDTLSARLGSPASLIDLPSQRLDQADGLLRARMARVFDGFVAQLSARAAGLRTPSQMISDRQRHLEKAEIQLIRAYPARLDRSGAALDRVSGLLDALSFTRVLARGYAVVRGHDGRVVQAGANLMPGTPLDILFGDGATRRADIASE